MSLSDEKKIRGIDYWTVADGYIQDSGKGIARLNHGSINSLGVSPGDLVEIFGKRRTIAKCLPLNPSDEDNGIVRIDRIVRLNAGVDVGDELTIRKVTAIPAIKIVLEYQGEREQFDFCWGDQSFVPTEAKEYIQRSLGRGSLKTENLSFKKSGDNKEIIANDGANDARLALSEEGKVKFTATIPRLSKSIWGDEGYRWIETYYYHRVQDGAINLYHSIVPPPIDGIYLTERLAGVPMCNGDKVAIQHFAGAWLFTVIEMTPTEANLPEKRVLVLIAKSD